MTKTIHPNLFSDENKHTFQPFNLANTNVFIGENFIGKSEFLQDLIKDGVIPKPAHFDDLSLEQREYVFSIIGEVFSVSKVHLPRHHNPLFIFSTKKDVGFATRYKGNCDKLPVVKFMHFFASLILKNSAILDNFDDGLDLVMCRELMLRVSKFCEDNNKQCVVVCNNPSTLNGLNLNSQSNKLFICDQSRIGNLKISQYEYKPILENDEPLQLSEQLMRGYIGGISKHL